MLHAACTRVHATDQHHRPAQRGYAEHVHNARSLKFRVRHKLRYRQRVEYPAQRRPDDGGELEDRRSPGDGIHKVCFRNQLWNQGSGGGSGKRARSTDEEQHHKDRKHAGLVRACQEQKGRGTYGLHAVTNENHPPTIEAIGNMPSRQKEDQTRNKLHQSGVTKVDRTVRHGIHLPRYSHRLRGVAKHRCHARQLKPPEVARGEGLHAAPGRLSGKCMHIREPRLYRGYRYRKGPHPSPVYPKGLESYSQSQRQAPSALAAAAVTLCGVCAFLELYCTQPMLPLLEEIFHASKTAVGMTVSAATLGVALAAPVFGALAERLPRKRVIVFALLGVSVPTLLAATSANLGQLIFWRFLQGVTVPGIIAMVITYIGEEWPPDRVALIMSFYVSGTAL